MPSRYQQMVEWVNRLRGEPDSLEIASSDASFRRYYRVRCNGQNYIIMDAPPEREDCRRFMVVARAMAELGLTTPQVHAADLVLGYLLLDDFGDTSYLSALNDQRVDVLYGDALTALWRLQTNGDPTTKQLSAYDAALLDRELALFPEWYLGHHLGLNLTLEQQACLARVFERLRDSALAQPRVWVHRDFHSRNLMVIDKNNPGILDFQDAVIGPITYDLVSLLRDCYIRWPATWVRAWALDYHQRLLSSGLLAVDETTFLRWFDWMGVQRHLKAAGIFARLKHRDGKPHYLDDIPRTLGYVREVAGRYPELSALDRLLAEVGICGP